MTEKIKQRNEGDRPPPSRRRTILLSVLATIVLFTIAILFALPWAIDYYTDGYSIHQPWREALVRNVLWEEPVRFDNRINGQSANYEPTLSADGSTMIFTRGKARHNADLYLARWNGEAWDDPRPLDSVNSPHDELGPELTRDGAYLYFYSNRDGGFGGHDIWVCRRTTDGWSAPENLGDSINSPFNEYGPGLGPDGRRIFFSSNRLRRALTEEEKDAWQATLRENFFVGDYDIFSAEISRPATSAPPPDSEPAVMSPFPEFGPAARVAALNSESDDGQVAVTPRGDFVYFSSNRAGGLGGFDLFRSRLRGGAIGEPENMGAPVNTASDDMDPSLFLEGHGLLLSSNRLSRAGDRPFLLFKTVSREVFTEKDWSGLAALLRWLDKMKWLLLLLLLSLLALLWLLRYLASPQFRLHASLLQRCLLASLLLHLLLAFLFSTWIVSSGLYDLAGEGLAEVFVDSDALAGERIGIEIREQVADLDALADRPQPDSPSDTLAMIDRTRPAEPEEIPFEPVRIEPRSAAASPALPVQIRRDPTIERLTNTNSIDSALFEESRFTFDVPEPLAASSEPVLPPLEVGERSERRFHEPARAAQTALRPDLLELEAPAPSARESMVAAAAGTNTRPDRSAESIEKAHVGDLPPAAEKESPAEIAMESPQVRAQEASRELEALSAPVRSARSAVATRIDRSPPRARVDLPDRDLQDPPLTDRSAVADLTASRPAAEQRVEESFPEVAPRRLEPQTAAASEIEMETPRKQTAAERSAAQAREMESRTAKSPESPPPSGRRADQEIVDLPAASRPQPLKTDRTKTVRPPLRGSSPETESPSTIELPVVPRNPDLVAEISRFEHGMPRTYHGLEMTSRRVVFCLDISGSMEWNNRIGEARQELLRLLDTLDTSVEFNIITFSGRMTIWNRGGLKSGTPENITSAKRFVRRTRTASDGTNTVGALSLALDDDKVKSIYFLSDGHPTVGFTTENEKILSHVVEQQAGRGVIINTIAYIKGDPPRGWRDQVPPKETLIDLMRRLAEQNNGNYVVFD